MSEPGHKVLKAAAAAAVRIFLPLVRLLLRHGIPYKTVAEWLRWCYATVAYEEFAAPGRKPSKSRVAVITGLTRVDVDRLLKMPSPVNTDRYAEYQRAARVLTGWARDPEWRDNEGRIRALPYDSPDNNEPKCFVKLVERFSGGTPPRAILDELIRVEAVEQRADGLLELKQPNYVPKAGEGSAEYMDILGHAASGLIDTIDHNTRPDCDETRLQGLAFNGRIPESSLPEVARHVKARGRELIFEIDDYLYTASVPEDKQATVDLSEVGIGIYYFQNDSPTESQE